MIGVYAGSFDPFTNGHLEIVDQAIEIFDKVIVLVADNPDKRHWLSGAERRAIIEKSVAEKVEVSLLTGLDLAVEWARRLGACLVRGLGEFTDYPAEKALAGINSRLRPEVKTVFLMTKGADSQMRSSAVRAALKYRFGWRSIREAVPPATFNAAMFKLLAGKAEAVGLPKPDLTSLSRYTGRPHHNLEHLVYMLDMAEEWNPDGRAAEAADLWNAVIYHDLFVDSDPEVEADEYVALSLRKLEEMNLSGCDRAKVAEMIQVTDHRTYTFVSGRGPDMTSGQELIRRLDLAILGESPYEYARYAEAVKREYTPKYGERYQPGRAAFLQTVLRRLAAGPIIDAEYDERMAVNAKWELTALAPYGGSEHFEK